MERIFVTDTFKNKMDLLAIFVFRATYPEKKLLSAPAKYVLFKQNSTTARS